MGGKKLRSEMRSILSRWRKSGLSLRAFAAESGVSYSKLTYWKKRCSAKDDVGKIAPTLVLVRLVGAQEEAVPPSTESYEVHATNGRRIVVRPGFDIDELRRLIVAVESC